MRTPLACKRRVRTLKTVDSRWVGREHERETAAARGTGEGHYDWDLGPNSSMTNANVDTVVQSTSGRDLKLSYKGGSNDVTVPPNVPVVTFTPATHGDLTPGKKVFVVATPASQGSYVAQRV